MLPPSPFLAGNVPHYTMETPKIRAIPGVPFAVPVNARPMPGAERLRQGDRRSAVHDRPRGGNDVDHHLGQGRARDFIAGARSARRDRARGRGYWVFITLEAATKDMRKEAAARMGSPKSDAGIWQTKAVGSSKHPRLQILAIEDLLA